MEEKLDAILNTVIREEVRCVLMKLMTHFPNHITVIESDWDNEAILDYLNGLIAMTRSSLEVNRTVVAAFAIKGQHMPYDVAQDIVGQGREEEE
tara:strand:+ start:4554 stop:4835 length:282 start_codon:yes stop_codon:yes gene_type:complete